jgi:WD40 repeat protein
MSGKWKELVHLKDGSSGGLAGAAFPTNGKLLAGSTYDNRILLWDTAAGTKLREWQFPGPVHALAFANDGRHLATANGNGTVYILRIGVPPPDPVAADKKLAELTAKLADPKVGRDALRQEVIAFRSKYAGLPAQTLRAAELLAKLPSPLDQLDPAKIPEDAKAAWRAGGRKPPEELVGVLGEHRGRHSANISSIAWSKDGKLIATGDEDAVIRLWDADTLQQRSILRGHKLHITGLAFHPDGARLLSAGWDHSMLWDLRSGKVITGVPDTGSVFCEAISTDGKRAGTGMTISRLVVTDLENLKTLRIISCAGARDDVRCAAFAGEGNNVVVGLNTGLVQLWDTDTGKALGEFKGHKGEIRSVTLSPDGKTIVSAAEDGTVRVWDVARQEQKLQVKGGAAALSPDGSQILSNIGNEGVLWNAATGAEIRRFRGHLLPIRKLTFSPDGKRASTAAEDRTVRLWDVATGKEVQPLTGHRGAVSHLDWSADGKQLLSTADGSGVRIWDVMTGKGSSEFPIGVHATFATQSSGIYAIDPINRLHRFDFAGVTQRSYALLATRFSDDRRRAVNVPSDGPMVVTDVENDREIARLPGHRAGNRRAIFGPAARTIVSCGNDGEVTIWDVASSKSLRQFAPAIGVPNGLAMSPNGNQLFAVLDGNGVAFWDLTRQDDRPTVAEVSSGIGQTAAYDPTGRLVASTHGNNLVVIWDSAAKAKLMEWKLPGLVRFVAFANDGRHLATANGNGTVYILRLPRGPDAAPPALTADQARQRQVDAARALGVPLQIENSINMKLNLIPAGRFLMGAPKDEPGRRDEEEQRDVEINQPYYIGVFEVTRTQYRKLMDEDRSSPGDPSCPADHVLWSEAVAFCKKLSELPAEKAAGRSYRLPTEAEWEYAWRAGTSTPFAFGSSLSSLQANFNGQQPYGGAPKGPNRQNAMPVGSFLPNAFGLCDMHGNVWEWCSDWRTPAQQQRVIRGGGYGSGAEGTNCRSAHRFGHEPELANYGDIGFRGVCEVPSADAKH